jgi:RluA family pseudouridine synthase
MNPKRIKVANSDRGKNLLRFLVNHFAGFSNKQLKSMIEMGFVTCNQMIVRNASLVVKSGDLIAAFFDLFSQRKQISNQLRIIREQEGYLLCHKPIGMTTDEKIFSEVIAKKVHLVHRLDKETSGILILAKNKKTQKKFEVMFRRREIQKNYIAVCRGILTKKQGTLYGRLAKLKKIQGQTLWTAKSANGLKALTEYRVLREGKYYSLISLHPITGRTHQLRVQLKETGHPIIGDLLYGDQQHVTLRMYLHAYGLRFYDPFTIEDVTATADLPKEFFQIMDLSVKSKAALEGSR